VNITVPFFFLPEKTFAHPIMLMFGLTRCDAANSFLVAPNVSYPSFLRIYCRCCGFKGADDTFYGFSLTFEQTLMFSRPSVLNGISRYLYGSVLLRVGMGA
ncbi:hypothetical protein GWI33_009559, partial [Rhynchophorus ferrugineus]